MKWSEITHFSCFMVPNFYLEKGNLHATSVFWGQKAQLNLYQFTRRRSNTRPLRNSEQLLCTPQRQFFKSQSGRGLSWWNKRHQMSLLSRRFSFVTLCTMQLRFLIPEGNGCQRWRNGQHVMDGTGTGCFESKFSCTASRRSRREKAAVRKYGFFVKQIRLSSRSDRARNNKITPVAINS